MAAALHPLAADELGRDRPRRPDRPRPGSARRHRAGARPATRSWLGSSSAAGASAAKPFVQAEDSDVLDASLLLMPLVHSIAPTDPRWLSTLDAIGRELVTDSLVHRYDPAASPDGLESDEGTFSMCSFWYVECLARAGRLEQAQLAFESAHLRQPPRALLRPDRPQRRAARQLPPSVHPPRPDQRCDHPRPRAQSPPIQDRLSDPITRPRQRLPIRRKVTGGSASRSLMQDLLLAIERNPRPAGSRTRNAR